MTKLDDIEKAVSALAPEELAKFRAWFEAFESELFDARIEQDAQSGKLDSIAEQAVADFKAGRIRNL